MEFLRNVIGVGGSAQLVSQMSGNVSIADVGDGHRCGCSGFARCCAQALFDFICVLVVVSIMTNLQHGSNSLGDRGPA
jgi:hypothetical protein